MSLPLSLNWIISTLKKSGINSKQLVIERLEDITLGDISDLNNDLSNKAKEIIFRDPDNYVFGGTCPFNDFKKDYNKKGGYHETRRN